MLLANVWPAASALQALAVVKGLMLTAIAVQMLVDGLVSIFCIPESVFFLNQSLFHRRNRKVTINIDPSKKIVSSFLLESKGS